MDWAAPSCGLLFALLSATTLLACSSGDRFTTPVKTPDAGLDQDSAVPPDAGLDAPPEDAAQEPACDPSSTPDQDPCVISEDYALFVSPNGSADTSTCGTRATPCASLHGIWAAAQAQHKKRVYICDNAVGYDEDVEIDGTANGVQVYGGFACITWQYDGTPAVFRNPAPDKPWYIHDVSGGITINGIQVLSGNAVAAGSSSIAVVVANSNNVVFRHAVLKAGVGAPGTSGENGTEGSMGPQVTVPQAGAPATCTSPPATQPGGAWNTVNACGSQGGAGGLAQTNHTGSAGTDGLPALSVNQGTGGTGKADGTAGSVGADGASGASGTAAPKIGMFQPVPGAFYRPADGFDGADGGTAQGGGGGGSSAGTASCVGASGGAGGMGGCGGKKGTGGTGGGASVGLLLFNSPTTLDDTTVHASMGGHGQNGGRGGAGGGGSLGAPGGAGVTGSTGGGGTGGPGGHGGSGGCGSGGSGGPSIAIVHAGPAPVRQNTVPLEFDIGGGLGYGGGEICAVPAPDGYNGQSTDILDVTQ